jgi:cytochrome P450
VTVSAASDVYFDPYDVEINANPYPAFARLRAESPLYYNEQYDFYALSRFADVNKALVDHETFSSARGAIVELIKANIEIPSGALIFEDPPIHDIHRKLLARMFTPRKINALEPKIRQYCANALDPLVGTGRFDFVIDLGAVMPMQVISALLGIPEETRKRSATTPTRRCAPKRANPWRPPTTGSSRVRSSRPTSTGAGTTRPTTS